MHDNGRETRTGMFTWRLKSQDPTTYLNIFQNIWKSAFKAGPLTDPDILYTKQILFIIHRLTKFHSLQGEKRFVTERDILLTNLSGSDLLDSLNAIQAHIVHSTFVFLKEQPANMVQDHHWRGRSTIETDEDGVSRSVYYSIGLGLNSQLEGGEKNNGFTKSTQYFVNREHDQIWRCLKQHQDFADFVAESSFPRRYKRASSHCRETARYWYKYDLEYSLGQVAKLQNLQQLKELSPRQVVLLTKHCNIVQKLNSLCVFCEELVPVCAFTAWATGENHKERLSGLDDARMETLHLKKNSNLCAECAESLAVWTAAVPNGGHRATVEPVQGEKESGVKCARIRRKLLEKGQFDEQEMFMWEEMDLAFNSSQEVNPPAELFEVLNTEGTDLLQEMPRQPSQQMEPLRQKSTRKKKQLAEVDGHL